MHPNNISSRNFHAISLMICFLIAFLCRSFEVISGEKLLLEPISSGSIYFTNITRNDEKCLTVISFILFSFCLRMSQKNFYEQSSEFELFLFQANIYK